MSAVVGTSYIDIENIYCFETGLLTSMSKTYVSIAILSKTLNLHYK